MAEEPRRAKRESRGAAALVSVREKAALVLKAGTGGRGRRPCAEGSGARRKADSVEETAPD
eukprot:1092347-Pleurochrysis_carterae.AAC.1